MLKRKVFIPFINLNITIIFQIKDVRDHRKEDRMESFFLAETTKYLYLLFDTDNFIHNQGQHGTVIETAHGECIVDSGGYIFNTEAHPIDPGALHCCSEVPNYNLLDIIKFEKNDKLFKGDTLDIRRHPMHDIDKMNKEKKLDESQNLTVEKEFIQENQEYIIEQPEIQDEDIFVEDDLEEDSPDKIQTVSNLESNENESQFQDDHLLENTFNIVPEFVNQILHTNIRPKFDPQLMLERIRTDDRYYRNETWENSYQLLSCEAQPFLQRISILGEFFST